MPLEKPFRALAPLCAPAPSTNPSLLYASACVHLPHPGCELAETDASMEQERKQAQAHEKALQVRLPSAFNKCSPTWMIGATVLRSQLHCLYSGVPTWLSLLQANNWRLVECLNTARQQHPE